MKHPDSCCCLYFITLNYHTFFWFQWKKCQKSNFYLPELNDLWPDGKLHGKSRFRSSHLVFLNWIHLERHWKYPGKLQKCPWKSPWKVFDFFFWKPVFTKIQFRPYHLSPFRMKTNVKPVIVGSHRHHFIDESLIIPLMSVDKKYFVECFYMPYWRLCPLPISRIMCMTSVYDG